MPDSVFRRDVVSKNGYFNKAGDHIPFHVGMLLFELSSGNKCLIAWLWPDLKDALQTCTIVAYVHPFLGLDSFGRLSTSSLSLS